MNTSSFFSGVSESETFETHSVGFHLFGPTWPKKTSVSLIGCEAIVDWTLGALAVASCDFYVCHNSNVAALPTDCTVMVSLLKLPLINFPQTTSQWVAVKPDTETVVHKVNSESYAHAGRPSIAYPIEGTFIFRFRLPPREPDPIAELGAPSYPYSVSQMLNSHVSDGCAPDVQFTVFSKRRKSGQVCIPRRLFGKQFLLLGKSEEFDLLIKNDFKRHETCPPFVKIFDYGYESDSDLEDHHEDEDDTHEGEDARVTESLGGMIIAGDTGRNAASVEGSDVPKNITRSIAVCDGAYATWKAFLFYLYTGHVVFAPLSSSGVEARNKFIEKHALAHPRWPSPCSPKSMYRLANKYGFTLLEDLALTEIVSRLTPQNIVEEYFSSFTLTYDNVQKPEFDYLRDMMRNSEVKAAWERHVPHLLASPEMVEYYYAASTKLLFPS